MGRPEDGTAPFPPIGPWDDDLLQSTHPPGWTNPEPHGRYNLVVIGGGTAGLVTAAGAAGLGAKVALVERALLGGDCLNVGCVPSKALIRSARAWADVRDANRYGVIVPGEATVDFPAVMQRMRRIRAGISPHDSAQRFRDLGVDVFLGEARFRSRNVVEVAGATLHFAKACIATGTRPSEPPIDGLVKAGYLSNETVFSLTELPRRLAVIGGGPIGCELAQAFARFGSQVVQVQAGPQLLGREDPEAAAFIERALRRDGVEILLNTKLVAVRRLPGGKELTLESADGAQEQWTVDEILLAVGRAPNVEALDLEAAGIAYDNKRGIDVNDRLQTSNRNVYAAGDICSQYQFTHMADAMARIVLRNALFFGRSQASALTVPWCTYTDPEIAHVGWNEAEAERHGVAVETFAVPLTDVDRARTDEEEEGQLKIHVRKGKDRIVGATLVARHAGDMISEITLAMVAGAGLGTIAETIHPYPTQAEVIKKAADAFNRKRLTPRIHSLFKTFLRWRR